MKWMLVAALLCVLSIDSILTNANSVVPSLSVINDAGLLLSGLDGQLVFVKAISGETLWSSQYKSPLLSSSHRSGIGVQSSDQIVMPGVDGSLFFAPELNPTNLELLEVSVRDIVEAAPFKTTDGTRFVASKHSQVTLIDSSNGVVQDRFSPEGWDTCVAEDESESDSDEHHTRSKVGDKCRVRPSRPGALWIGKTDYTVRAIDGTTGKLRWNVTFSEISSCIDDHVEIAGLLDRLPRIFASPDGHVWALNHNDDTVMWRVKLDSVLSRVHIRVDSDIVPMKHTYAPAAPSSGSSGSSSTSLTIQEPVLTKMSNGQVFVISNAGVKTGISLAVNAALLPAPDEVGQPSTKQLPQPPPKQLPQLYPPASADDVQPSPADSGLNRQREDRHQHRDRDDDPLLDGTRARRDSIHITLQLPDNPFKIAFSIGLAVIVSMFVYRLMAKLARKAVESSWFGGTVKEESDEVAESAKRKKGTPEVSPRRSSNPSNQKGTFTIGKITIQTRSLLGLGSHGTIVFDGFFEGRSVAVKRLQKHLFMHASKEISLLIDSDRHPHVLRYYSREDDDNFIYVALERCRCSLSDLVTGTVKMDPLLDDFSCPLDSCRFMLHEIVAGVEYLHSINIVHRDLKPQNVLVTADNRPKIADMGLSTRLDQDRSSFDSCQVGSVGWHAPELMTNGRLTKSVDIFSLGCIVYYVLTGGRHPFGEGFERDSNILQGRYNLRRIEHLPEAMDLVQTMIDRDPESRATSLEILRHPFFWSDEQKLDFLQEMSDRVEVEKPDSKYRIKLEKQAGRVVTRAWDRVLDASLLANLGKYRKYNFGSIRDCLRVIRNKKNHYRDLPEDVQQALGEFPSGFLRYFTSRFPSLLLYAHAFAGMYFRQDMSRHFVGLSKAALKRRWRVWSIDDDEEDDEDEDDETGGAVEPER